MQRLLLVVGSLAVLAISFFGTLHSFDNFDFRSVDSIRIEHAKEMKAALEKYRAARGKYPGPFNDNDLADLRPELVGGGFIAKLPVDPYWSNRKINHYRYRSDGSTYGLLFSMEFGPCISGIGAGVERPWGGYKIRSCWF